MGQVNNCSYCKHKYEFKFPFTCWWDVINAIWTGRKTKPKTITFMYDNKPWIIDKSCDIRPINGDLHMHLVEPITKKKAREKTSWDYRWYDKLDKERDLKRLKKIPTYHRSLDIDIVVEDVLGSDKSIYCGITSVTGREYVKIWLEKAWSCKA